MTLNSLYLHEQTLISISHQSNSLISICSEPVEPAYERQPGPKLVRLENSNGVLFNLFKYLGFITVRWETNHYAINKIHFTISYISWFILPTLGVVLSAFLLSKISSEDFTAMYSSEHHSNTVYVFCVAVVPSLQAFTIRMVSKSLPDILYKMAEISGRLDNKKSIGMVQVLMPYLKLSKNSSSSTNSSETSIFTFLPVVTVLISTATFWTLWSLTLLRAIESIDISIIINEWLHFTLLFVYGIMTFFSNWFCAIVMEWFRLIYASFGSSFRRANIQALEEDNKTLHLVSECFHVVNGRFLEYICTLNIVISTVSAIFSMVKLFSGFEMIFYSFPLLFSVNMIWFMCYHSSKLLHQHSKLISELKSKISSTNDDVRRSHFRAIRENLMESVPQLTLYGQYHVSTGLMVSIYGFIITYSLVVQEILGPIKFNLNFHGNNTVVDCYRSSY